MLEHQNREAFKKRYLAILASPIIKKCHVSPCFLEGSMFRIISKIFSASSSSDNINYQPKQIGMANRATNLTQSSHILKIQAPLSPSSIPTSTSTENKLKTHPKMHKSLKTKTLISSSRAHDHPNGQPNCNKSKVLSNLSISKSKKLTESYYNTNGANNITNQAVNSSNLVKSKQNSSKLKSRSHNQLAYSKSSKSKLFPHRKPSKNRLDSQQEQTRPQSKHRSLNRVLSAAPGHDSQPKMLSYRTLSPELQRIHEQLEWKQKDKKSQQQQEQLLDRMSKVLDQYRQAVMKEIKQKEVLARENRRLREKLQIVNGEKKYKAVHEYNV